MNPALRKTATVIGASALSLLLGCSEPTPKFSKGQIVQSVISEQEGQVVHVLCFGMYNACFYDVRFKTRIIEMQEFELKPNA